MKLSIVVPVYGVEKYIKDCISSLLVPDCSDYEIIIVNDGTKDRSIDIVREHFDDPRIRIVEQENAGLSAARNRGLEESSGEYVWFFDSDDWAETSLIKDVCSYLGNSYDLIVFPSYYRNYEEDGRECVVRRDITADRTSDLVQCPYFHPTQFYIIRKSVLQANNHRFYPGILHEDSLFTPILLNIADSVKCYPRPVYHYRQRSESITKTVSPKRIYDLLFVIDNLLQYADAHISAAEKYTWGRCLPELVNSVLCVSQRCRDEKALLMLKRALNGNRKVLDYLSHGGRNNKVLSFLSKICGGNLCRVYGLLYKIRY